MGKSEERQKQAALNYKMNGGNLKQAMIDAGYSESYADKNSQYLLGIIGQDIKTLQNEVKSDKIMSITELQEWWSGRVKDDMEKIESRVKCSELLAKSLGAFVDKVEVKNKPDNPYAGLTTEELKKLIDDD